MVAVRMIQAVRASAVMLPRWTCVALVYTLAALHYAQSDEKCDKRSRAVWYNAKFEHEGQGLSDAELHRISTLTDMNHFKNMLKPILVPRVVGSENHEKVRQHLISAMTDLGWTVEEDAFQSETPVGKKAFSNVIATLDPEAPRRLVLACHYDSKLDREGAFIGATDSAVPCAMLINIAKALKGSLEDNRLRQSDLTLQFLFIDGEEAFRRWSAKDSLYGARNLASKWHQDLYPRGNRDGTTNLHRIDLFVLLDLIGTEDVNFYSYFPETEPWYSRLVSYERRLNDLGLLARRKFMFQANQYYNAHIEDDHVPFLKKGVPILHLISLPFPSVWHKNSDNESALHYPSIKNTIMIMTSFVADYMHLVV